MVMPIVIAGLGKKGESPISIISEELGVPLYSWEDVEKNWEEFNKQLPTDGSVIKLCGHSLGAYCCVLMASHSDNIGKDFELTIVEPIPGDVNHPWLQLGAQPIQLTPNVKSCWNYLRMGYAFQPWTWTCCPPYHQPLLMDDGVNYRNFQIKQSDHNSIVGIMEEQILERLRG